MGPKMATIRKRTLPSGKAVYLVDYKDQFGKRRAKQFSTKKAADAYLVKARGEVVAGTHRPEAGKVNVREVAEGFIKYCEGRNERGEQMTTHCLATYRGHVSNHILHPEHGLGAVPLAHLTTARITEFRDRIRSAGVSVPTTRKILATLHGILRKAVEDDVLAINPATGIRVIGRRGEGSKKIVPPSKDAMRLIMQAADENFRAVLIVASATGMRAGELWALRWKHVDLVGGEVRIETRVDAYGEEDVTKTDAGMRTVPLGASVVSVLKAWKLRSKFSKTEDLVFPNEKGGYTCHPNLVKRRFLPLFAALDAKHKEDPANNPPAPPLFNWHGLRHFAVSCWIEAGLAPKTVQTFAGHSSLQVTMDRYGHLFKSSDHAAAMDRIAANLYEAQ